MKEHPKEAPAARTDLIIATVALAAFAVLAFAGALGNSATSDELTHLAAGRSYLATGDFRLNREHPPLLKATAALPLANVPLFPDETRAGDAAMRLREAWETARTDNGAQWRFARIWFYGVTNDALRRSGGTNDSLPSTFAFAAGDFVADAHALLLRSRAVMIVFGLLLGALIFAWSHRLWGSAGAAVSACLFAFDPNFIAHSALITTDVGVSLFITAALFYFWRATAERSWSAALLFALAFSLAFLSKFSAVLLVPMLGVIAMTSWRRTAIRDSLLLIIGALAAALMAIWIAYLFRAGDRVDVRAAVEDAAARRSALAAFPAGVRQEDVDRIRGTAPLNVMDRVILAADRAGIVPETYLHGFAVTAGTAAGRPSFIRGRFSLAGFRDYFFWTTIYKLPLITLIAITFGVILGARSPARMFLLVPIVVYLTIAVTLRMNIGHRHILPLFPFVYVLCGSLGAFLERRRRIGAVALVTLAITANLVLLPRPAPMIGRHLSYVNELGGGPVEGFRSLTDSNFDWGQDLRRLGIWLREHDVDEPVNLVYFGTADPRYYGVRFHDLRPTQLPVEVPGYLAVSTIDYLGVLFSSDRRGYWEGFVKRTDARLVGRAGYSILIFRVERLPP